MSVLLAVGSPALTSYSLGITLLNRSWIRDRFEGLHAQSLSVSPKYPEFERRVKDAQYILQEVQQVPIRASQAGGWLSSLVVLPGNQHWWTNVRKDLHNTRRGVTYSLVAQIAVAVIAWLFTVISAFIGDLGDASTALQISSNNVCAWMVSSPLESSIIISKPTIFVLTSKATRDLRLDPRGHSVSRSVDSRGTPGAQQPRFSR